MAPTHAKPAGWVLPRSLSLSHTHSLSVFVCVCAQPSKWNENFAKGRPALPCLGLPCGVSWSQDIQDIYLSYKSIAVAVARPLRNDMQTQWLISFKLGKQIKFWIRERYDIPQLLQLLPRSMRQLQHHRKYISKVKYMLDHAPLLER